MRRLSEQRRESLRSLRHWALAAGLTIAVLGSGCSNRRERLRPVYGSPAISSPCPPGDPGCAGSGGSSVNFGAPSRVNGSSLPNNAVPSKSSGGDEPGLNLNGSGRRIDPKVARASQAASPRGSQTDAAKRAAIRAKIAPFVNDPGDLFLPPKADRAWRYIVIHESATVNGGLARIDAEHRKQKGYAGCGYHFIIGNGSDTPDGRIEVAERWSKQAAGAHCRDAKAPEVNEYGIGVCLVGEFDAVAPTDRQLESLRALIAYLQDRYRVPDDNVGTHSLFASKPVPCPGRKFPASEVLERGSLAHR